MAAAPQKGTFTFLGLTSGRTYQKPFYNADVNGTLCRIEAGNGTPGSSGGQDYCAFDEPVRLIDVSIVTGTTDTLNMRLMTNYQPTAFMFNNANHVNTLTSRPPVNIGFNAGTRISFMQIP